MKFQPYPPALRSRSIAADRQPTSLLLLRDVSALAGGHLIDVDFDVFAFPFRYRLSFKAIDREGDRLPLGAIGSPFPNLAIWFWTRI